jgi:hypothetical protein
LGADAAGLLIPGATGLGAAVRAADKVDNVIDAAKAIENTANAVEAGKTAEKVAEAGTESINKISDTGKATRTSTDFVVTEKGTAIPIPNSAIGPSNPKKGSGMVYQGGSGGKGMDKKVTGVRIMDANNKQGKRVNYMNKEGQTVDPKTGRTISNKDPRGHIPLE